MSQSNLGLPRFFAFQSGGSFAQFLPQAGDLHGHIRFDQVGILSPYTKFEFEPVQSPLLDSAYHIKNSYSSKYLSIRRSQGHQWIVAGADQPVEDTSDPNCTVFFLFPSLSTNWGFRHGSPTGAAIRPHSDTNSLFNNCLRLNTHNIIYSFMLRDLDSIVILPKLVAFKNPSNGQYLTVRTLSGNQHLQFGSADILNSTTWFETFTTRDGGVRIRSVSNNRFWSRSTDSRRWVFANSGSEEETADTQFWGIRVAAAGTVTFNNAIVLSNTRNPNAPLFCNRFTADSITSCLACNATEVTQASMLFMEDIVRKREIYNVTFRTLDAKIYDFSNPYIVTKETVNQSQQEAEGDLSFTYTEVVSNSWDTTQTEMLSRSVSISTRIPYIASGSVEVGRSFEDSYSMGESIGTEKEVSTNLRVEIPPMTKTRVTMVVSQASIDIPFSYTQRDVLLNNTTVIARKDDGFFRGITTLVKYDIADESLDDATKTKNIVTTETKSKL